MTPRLAFDPGALVELPTGEVQLVEAVLSRDEDDVRGRLRLELWDDYGNGAGQITLRPGFLDELLAQARAREADAA